MNSLRIAFCSICTQNLRQYGNIAKYVFENIAIEYLSNGPEDSSNFMFSHQVLCEFLESKGYIVSTENGMESLVYKPNGIIPSFLSDFEYLICINPHEHDFRT